jgi:hypothetical protein
MIYNILIHAHSGLRWIFLVVIVLAVVHSARRLNRPGKPGGDRCGVLSRVTMILAHLQLVVGLVLYFISPKVIFAAESMKNSLQRFFLVEHIALMLIAIVLITLGYVKSGKAPDDRGRYKKILVYYGIALVLILVSIPWPFRGLGAGWF